MTPKAPAGLGTAGRRLWRDTHAAFDLSPIETAILAQACSTLDEIARLEEALEDEDAMVPGSAGQVRPHPGIDAIRRQKETFSHLIAALKEPKDEGKTQRSATPVRARARRSGTRGGL